ncbi:hypothetical protein [Bacillus atrophaeus]|uniref:hypothetical protein n=1 Tax=Bacillus atrophaeus TaxID=1452 RepID=UPI002E225C35|nr:hypothetical protein [Bacillus atrophaeus]
MKKGYAFRPNLNAMGYDELIAHGEDVMRAIRLRAYGEGYRQGKFDAEIDATHEPENNDYPYGITDEDIQEAIKEARRDRAQARRDEIVKQAKADVEKLCSKHRPEFIVNRQKHTVVSLLRNYLSGVVHEKGIAKAAPSDCFNVHIGRAIALRRVLGLAVPDEYLNAPQPTEVRVGDVVRSTVDKSKEYVIAKGEKAWCDGMAGLSSMVAKYGRIIDDSREEVGE